MSAHIPTWQERLVGRISAGMDMQLRMEHAVMQAEIADLRAALAVRDGWQLVPVEATPGMCEAGRLSGIGLAWSYAGCWRAMLAAAPRPL